MIKELGRRWAEFRKKAEKTLRLIALASMSPLLGCGFTTKFFIIHDHQGSDSMVVTNKWGGQELYDPQKHGQITEFYKEGQGVTGPTIIRDNSGLYQLTYLHSHSGTANTYSGIEYKVKTTCLKPSKKCKFLGE